MPDFVQSTSDQSSALSVHSTYGRFSFARNKYFAILIVALVAAGAGFVGGSYYQVNRPRLTTENVQEVLPLPFEVVTNGIIYNWRAELSGTISSKDDQNSTLVITNASNKITVKVVQESSLSNVTSGKSVPVRFSDLKVDDYVLVSIQVPLKGTVSASGSTDDLVVRTLSVSKK